MTSSPAVNATPQEGQGRAGTGSVDPADRLTAPPGLKGLVVADTAIGEVRGDQGLYHYRGRDACRLATTTRFEQLVGLLLDIPDDEVDRALPHARSKVSPALITALTSALAVGQADDNGPPSPLATLVGGLQASVDSTPTVDQTPQQRAAAAIDAIGVAPVLLAGAFRSSNGERPLAADPGRSHAADYLRLLTGREPTPVAVATVETYLNLTADHGFNASTFTARVIASTGADVPAAVTGAIGALNGPLHGGAPSRVLDMLNAIGDPGETERWARSTLESGRKIMGFGHAVYRTGDPRSAVLRQVADNFTEPHERDLVARAEEIEQRLLSVLGHYRPNSPIVTNVEYYAAVVLHLAGVPQEMFTATFMVSRIAGWCAHILEQAAANKIMRPSSRYIGPPPMI